MQHVLIPPGRTGSPLLTTGAAARVAGCSRTTIHRAIVRGELDALRLGEGGHYRVRREALADWLRDPTTEEET